MCVCVCVCVSVSVRLFLNKIFTFQTNKQTMRDNQICLMYRIHTNTHAKYNSIYVHTGAGVEVQQGLKLIVKFYV